MKAKRRHKLQENDLASELVKIWEFLKLHGNKIATGALVVAVLILIYVLLFNRGAEISALQRDWNNLMDGRIAKGDDVVSALQRLAGQSEDGQIAALARVELGYVYATRALVAGKGTQGDELSGLAKQQYNSVIKDFEKTQPLAVAKAYYGLANLAESAGDFAEAERNYTLAQNVPGMAAYPVAVLAKLGIQNLKELREPVNMVTTMPSTATAPAPGPATTMPASPVVPAAPVIPAAPAAPATAPAVPTAPAAPVVPAAPAAPVVPATAPAAPAAPEAPAATPPAAPVVPATVPAAPAATTQP